MKKLLKSSIDLIKSKYTIMIIPNSTKKSFQISISKILVFVLIFSNISYLAHTTIKNHFLNKNLVVLQDQYNKTALELSRYDQYADRLGITLEDQTENVEALQEKLMKEKETYTTRLKELEALEESFVALINKFNYENNFDIEVATSRSLSLGRELTADSSIATTIPSSDDEFMSLIELDLNKYDETIQAVEAKLDFLESKPDLTPHKGRISSDFGWRRHPVTGASDFHDGVDVTGDVGDDIKAAGAGIVTYSGYNGTYGYVIIISHGYGYKSIYAHNNKNLVKAGEEVKKGQIIAELGNTGRSTGAHVHVEIHKDGEIIDPETLIDF